MTAPKETAKKPERHSHWRKIGVVLIVLIGLLSAGRLVLPHFLRWYVIRTIDQNPLYEGEIGEIEVHLWRGAYSIDDVRLNKTTGDVPVPFFSSKRLDLQLQWNALLHRRLVGQLVMQKPELNFVDDPDASRTQTGENGPWMQMLEDLFPFKINRAVIVDGHIHFRTFASAKPVDVYLSYVNATIDNLTNIYNELTPNAATVHATALAMDQAPLELEMKLNPFAYYPTFHLAVRLIGLDVTKVNDLARAYGGFDFERGWFDLVVELNARHGQLEGYVKPLFRNLTIFSLTDLKEDNPLEAFWEAVVGVTTTVLKNQPRNQFGTLIPLRGSVARPQAGVITTVGNVLRNAFIRAYLPRLQGSQEIDGLEFGPASITEPVPVASTP